jgi:hypothetical protein
MGALQPLLIVKKVLVFILGFDEYHDYFPFVLLLGQISWIP